MANSIEPRPLTSAFESPTFGEDSSFHVEQPVGSMSISPCGRDVVLASKEGLHVIDLDSPYSPPRYLPHRTPWEVADVQWSPFAARDHWVASTSNQKALVWNLAMKTWQNSIEFVLHAHSRAITDINFSAHHPDRLATCAVDSFIHCWDLRTPLRPAISFSDWFAGATQVKWNRQDPHVIASSHDRFLRIWDDRMGAYPIKSIEAHNTKIYGVDWNRVRPGAVVTCSLDKTIKFWDYTVEGDVPEKIIRAPFPVWRARNTPFGWGVLAMPQRGNSDLHLYSRRAGEGANPDENLPLVHTFPGHKGQVKEFLWRPRGGVSDGIDCREFQLVSWGTDRELRLHRVNPDILQRVGYEKGKSFISNLNVTRTGAVYRSFRDENDDTSFDETEPVFHSSPYFSNGIGMNAVSTPYGRTWKRGGRVDSRVGMRGRSNLRADTNPISWMRGVKISGWDIETLGDEITHVGEKFTKVYFDSVDIRQRKATISLHGPWGADGATLFLKVDIRFPVDYPKNSMPSFSVQKTAGVTDELASNISAELGTIAETYLSRKRSCLEGIVRYLLGENTLEESIAWILGEAGETVKFPINGELEGESSDEDEVGLSRSQELGMSSELLRPPNANVMVPVAKACGALWAMDGRLVCFFPPKKDKSGSFMDHLGFKEMTRLSRADKVFEGFGRLQANSPGPQIGGGITSAEEASDDSDDSDVESSSSSGSSDILSGLQTRFPAPRTWRSGGSLGFHRPRSTDNSQMSTIGGMGTKSSDTPKNVISIHDFSDLLPAKRELARKYRISGKGTDVCAYNASAALDAGYHELARIWGLVKLVLHNREAVTLPDSGFAQQPGTRQIHRRDSAVDLTYDIRDQTQGIKRSANGAVQWGDHPFGGKWLVPSLLEHFEKIGDIQMLAMLSCVLHGPKRELDLSPDENHSEKSASRRRERQSFSLDFYSGNGPAQVKSQSQTPLASTPKDSHATPITHSSGRSSAEFWRPESTPPCSTGTTPPLATRAGGMAAERKPGTQNVAIASSPDQQSQPRSGSGLGSVLASSFTRSFNFGPSSASPPASVLSKKKNTGNNPYAGGGGTGVWTTSAFTAKPASAIPDYLTTSTALTSRTHSDTESERPQPSPKSPAKLKVTLKNKDAFDNGRSQNLFLEPNKDWIYRSYRAEYANLLSVWGLPVQQSEVLKIGGSVDRPDPHLGRQHFRSLRASFSLPTDLLESQLVDDLGNHGLDIHQHCLNCGNTLDRTISTSLVGTDVASKRYTRRNYPDVRCPKCDAPQPLPSKLPCIICGEMVERMLIPCLNCGHVCCFACHKAWFSRASGPNEGTRVDPEIACCPSGCGCNCSEHTILDAPMFRNLSSAEPDNETGNSAHSPTSPLGRMSQSKFGQTKVGQHEADLDAWQASPFATLARGLGGGLSRGLRAEDIRRPRQFVPKKTSMNRVENG